MPTPQKIIKINIKYNKSKQDGVKKTNKRQRAPKVTSREPQNAFKTIIGCKTLLFGNVSISLGKSRLLRVGGSAWELKIVAKRFQKKMKSDFEKGRT